MTGNPSRILNLNAYIQQNRDCELELQPRRDKQIRNNIRSCRDDASVSGTWSSNRFAIHSDSGSEPELESGTQAVVTALEGHKVPGSDGDHLNCDDRLNNATYMQKNDQGNGCETQRKLQKLSPGALTKRKHPLK